MNTGEGIGGVQGLSKKQKKETELMDTDNSVLLWEWGEVKESIKGINSNGKKYNKNF